MQLKTIIGYDKHRRELWRTEKFFRDVEELKGYLDECETENRAVHRIEIEGQNGNVMGYTVVRGGPEPGERT